MKRPARLMSFGWLCLFCLVLGACSSNPYVGTWKPVPSGSDNDHMRIDSLNINKDGTFSIKYKDSSRKDINGTHATVGDKLELSVPDSKRKVEAKVESDGRLAISEGGNPPVYFAKG